MDYLASFNISASGMSVEKTRLDVLAMNLANTNSTRGVNGAPYQPLQVISSAKATSFDEELSKYSLGGLAGAEILEIKPMEVEPRLVFDPNHPDANEKGYVAYPNINNVSEMVNLIEATRAYEANVKALNAAKSMALKALEIGSSR